jgi:anti-sigma B factor antagonist
VSGGQVEERKGVAIARLEGEIDHANGERVGRQLERTLAESESGLVVDLTSVEFLDSAAISAFFRLARLAGEQERWFGLVVPAGSMVDRVLRVVALDEVVPLSHDLDDALDEALRAASL